MLYLDRDKNKPLVNGLAKMLYRSAKLKKRQTKLVHDGELYEFDMFKYLKPQQIAELKEKFKGIVCLK
ncbi:hypothetical protein FC35_GL000364 [Limosilactobacillus coleohominis DSM 14060]|nr:hypothetical protein FC35_GL000364 [Limosilactobacillus coleohominis DSM 14060]